MSAKEEKPDTEAIKILREQYMAAQATGDADGCVSFWCDDGVLMPPDEPAVAGKEALHQWYRKAFDAFTLDFALTYDLIEVAGDWSFARGTGGGTMVPKAGGPAIQYSGKFLEIHRRQPDGTWKFACHMWNSNEPAGEGSQ